jgi:hypothetical protein
MSINVPVIIGQGSRFQNPLDSDRGSGETNMDNRVSKIIFFRKAKTVVSKSGLLKQSRFLIFFIFTAVIGLDSCDRGSENVALIPPPTPPLSRYFLGYGVVNVSYIQVLKEPVPGSESLGYLRRSSLVRIMERRRVNNRGTFESWVLVEGNYRGWLREEMVWIYDNEAQAKTAAGSMSL